MDAIDVTRIYSMLLVPNEFVKGLMRVIEPTLIIFIFVDMKKKKKKRNKFQDKIFSISFFTKIVIKNKLTTSDLKPTTQKHFNEMIFSVVFLLDGMLLQNYIALELFIRFQCWN